MNDSRSSTGMETFIALSREEPFRTDVLFVFGFLTTSASLVVLTAFLAVQLLTKLPFVHLGLPTATAISFAFSLYFVAGFIVWYRHYNYNA